MSILELAHPLSQRFSSSVFLFLIGADRFDDGGPRVPWRTAFPDPLKIHRLCFRFMARTLIMSPARVHRTLRRLAHEIVERNRGAEAIELFGIWESGVPLARALVEEVNNIEETDLDVHGLDVTPFRDDRPDLSPPETLPHEVDATDRDIVLVDDVLFTGRTARAALDAVLQYGRPCSIQLVVLIDRGHREYPIQPDYTGRLLQTKHREEVIVDTSDEFAVHVED